MVNDNGTTTTTTTTTTHPPSNNTLVPSPSSSSPYSSRDKTIATTTTTTTTSIKSLIRLLQYIYKYDGGIYGLYRGCDIQLLHVSLKGALMLMIRERIQRVLLE